VATMRRLRGARLDGAEQPVAGVTEAGHDVAAVVQPLVHARGHDAHGRRHIVGERFGDPGDAIPRGPQADGLL
jgi:hypothetical protein